MFAALVGAGAYADAFVVAFRIPNLLRDLFAEGALSAAFIPTFADHHANQTRERAWALANRLMNVLAIGLGLLVLVAGLFAEDVVRVLAAHFGQEQVELTALLTRIMLPFLPIVSLAAVAMGMLNAQNRFGVTALAPALFNVGSIAVGGALFLLGADPRTAVIGWSAGTLLGGVAQWLIQVWALRGTGWRYTVEFGAFWRDPGIRRIARLMAPATIGLAATQVNIVVNTYFASSIIGAPAWLSYAFRLMQLPIGVFGVAIATVSAASVAQRAAARDHSGVSRTLGDSLRLVAFLTIPATAALAALAEPIIRLIFEYGRFTSHDTQQTALALLGYAVGLYAYAAVKVVAPAFYALDRPRAPMVASLAAVAVNVGLNVALFPWLGFVGLALGTSAAALTNFALLLVQYRRAGGRLEARGISRQLAKVTAAAALAAGSAMAFAHAAGSRWGEASVVARLVQTIGALGLGGAIYAVSAYGLRVSELTSTLAAVRRRLGR